MHVSLSSQLNLTERKKFALVCLGSAFSSFLLTSFSSTPLPPVVDISMPHPNTFFPPHASPLQALAYDGPAYRGLDAATFSEEDWAFGARSVRLLSGLYGVLRPTDLIQPYRLEMGSRWAAGNLSPGGGGVVDLASGFVNLSLFLVFPGEMPVFQVCSFLKRGTCFFMPPRCWTSLPLGPCVMHDCSRLANAPRA